MGRSSRDHTEVDRGKIGDRARGNLCSWVECGARMTTEVKLEKKDCIFTTKCAEVQHSQIDQVFREAFMILVEYFHVTGTFLSHVGGVVLLI